MSLLSLDILEGKTSKYETNHIHMIVDGEISFPVTNMNDKQYGTFFHEYIHYLQHFTTMFGVKICTMYNKMFILYVDYLKHNKTVKLPLELWKENQGLMNFISFFNDIKGDRNCPHHIDEVEISPIEISLAKSNRCAVQIGLYDFENDIALESGFKFGYTCIIESMAHLIQSFINEELYHPTIPYCAAELIFRAIYADKSHDIKMMISLCFCSLMFDNPGVAFFEMINYSKNNPTLNGYELYKKLIRDHSNFIKYKKEEMPIYRALCIFLDELKVNISQAIGCKLDYYDEVIENCKNEIKSGNSVLLDILYNADISDKNYFSEVFEKVYGYPFIEADNMTVMPMDNSRQPSKPYIETATMIGLELIFKRVKSYNNTTCSWYKTCSKALYTQNDKTSIECLCDQWNKTELCLMTEALRYYGIKDNEYIQE